MALILQEGVQDSFRCFYPGTFPFPEAVDRRGHGEVAQDAHDKTAAGEELDPTVLGLHPFVGSRRLEKK